jgi:hypothetical protein
VALKQISQFTLHNGGGFVAKGAVMWTDSDGMRHRSASTGNVLLGQTAAVDPGKLGVPDGATVDLYVSIQAGKDNEAQQQFQ